MYARAAATIWSVSASIAQAPPSGSATSATPLSSETICWVRSARRADVLGRQPERLVARVRVQRLGAAAHRRQRLDRHPHDVVLRLLGGERRARGLGVEAQPERALVVRRVALAHQLGPQPPRGAELRHLLEEVVVGVEEEREARGEVVDREPALERGVDVGEAVGEGEGDLLHRGRARLAHVVAGDRDRVPPRHLVRAELDQVGDQLHRGLGRVDVGAARGVLLEQVVLHRAADLAPGHALLLGHDQVEGEQDRRRGVDGHRGRDAVERDAVEQAAHVGDRRDRHADAPDLAARQRVVGVVADLGRQVEGHREAGRALLEKVAVAAVRLGRVGEAGVLAHRPAPLAIALGVEAAGEGKGAGRADRGGVERGDVGGTVARRERQPAHRPERVAEGAPEGVERGGFMVSIVGLRRPAGPAPGGGTEAAGRRFLVAPAVTNTTSWGQALDRRLWAGYLSRPGPVHMFLGIARAGAGAVFGVPARRWQQG